MLFRSVQSIESIISKMNSEERVSSQPKVYVIQEIAGTREGNPKINIIGAAKYGSFLFCLPDMAQIIFSPGPFIFPLMTPFTDYT